MNCDEARDHILTDALDAEIGPSEKRDLLTHLVACEACRLLMAQAEESLQKPFLKAVRPTPPAHVWNSISTELERIGLMEKEEPPMSWTGLVRQLRLFFHGAGRRFALGMAAIISIAIISFSLRSMPGRMSGGLKPVAASLALICEGDSAFEKRIVSCAQFDTPIEKLFF